MAVHKVQASVLEVTASSPTKRVLLMSFTERGGLVAREEEEDVGELVVQLLESREVCGVRRRSGARGRLSHVGEEDVRLAYGGLGDDADFGH